MLHHRRTPSRDLSEQVRVSLTLPAALNVAVSSALEISSYSLADQDPSPLVDPGSADSLAKVPSAPNGFDSLDPTQDSYDMNLTCDKCVRSWGPMNMAEL